MGILSVSAVYAFADSEKDYADGNNEALETVKAGTKPFEDSDRVWFYNVSGDTYGSDMILVESNGRYGLIDSGNRYSDTITDVDGTEYDAPYMSELSCQTVGRNGRDGMTYMIKTLGVKHLDFIIATHSHSDHIGGIPEISELTVEDEDGTTHSLIDSSTIYFYKNYKHINDLEDDLGEKSGLSWHNQAFFNNALQAVISKGAIRIDVGFSSFPNPAYYEGTINEELYAKSENSFVSGLQYYAGVREDSADDRLSFSWGNMDIDLYNLFLLGTVSNENVNSIASVITVGGHSIYTAGDIDVQEDTEQKIAGVIALQHGNIELVKASHHGYNYSNSKVLVDLFQPKAFLTTSRRSKTNIYSPSQSFRAMKYYAETDYNTVFYEVGASDQMLACNFDDGGLNVREVMGEGSEAVFKDADGCINRSGPADGWTCWYQKFNSSTDAVWYYFNNGRPLTGWHDIDGCTYFFNEDGFMQSDMWIDQGDKKYWLLTSGKMAADTWAKAEGEWYFFGKDGVPVTDSWKKDNTGWCWLDSEGRITRSKWIRSSGEWYYLKADGYMAAGEWARDGIGWCWMDPSGKITKSKWIKPSKDWYYLKANGYMAANEWAKDSTGWMFMDGSGKITRSRWIRSSGEWYYLKASGYMAANEWTKDSAGWMFMDGNGEIMKSRWVRYKNDWYYLKSNGYMATGTVKINGRTYVFDPSGKWAG